MKKILNKNTYKGFTLVELLVVVAIIAILSVVGLTLFNGAQVNARDARRKADIDAIANAIEIKRAVGKVVYSPIVAGDMSSGTIPVDSVNSTYQYCIKTYTTDSGAQEANPLADAWTADAGGAGTTAKICPSGFSQAVVANAFNVLETAPFYDGGGTADTDLDKKAWKICARLETSGGRVYCKNSAQ